MLQCVGDGCAGRGSIHLPLNVVLLGTNLRLVGLGRNPLCKQDHEQP